MNPTSIDFGNWLVNTTGTKEVTIKNNCGFALSITLGPLQGTDPKLFAYRSGTGEVIALPDQAATTLDVDYTPRIASPVQSQAYFVISPCGDSARCDQTVRLSGTGVGSCLDIEPHLLDFGFTQPGISVTKYVTLANICSDVPVHLTADPAVLNNNPGGGTTAAGPFQPGAGFPTKDTLIPPRQSVQVPVLFTAPTLSEFTGELDISTDDANASNITTPLSGYGGGAIISCATTPLDFGLSAVGISSTLALVCTNVGTDVPGHPETKLFIPDPTSSVPGISLETGNSAFKIEFETPFPMFGLTAGESTAIDVTYQPQMAGTDANALLISSNGAPGNTTRIPLTGLAKVLPPCDFTLAPENLPLDFGHVTPGLHAVLSFGIENQGSEDCVAGAFQLLPASSPAFSLPDFAGSSNTSQTIPGGGQFTVNVRYAPINLGMSIGTLTFSISDPNNPYMSLSLTGTSP